jgi:protein ImuA
MSGMRDRILALRRAVPSINPGAPAPRFLSARFALDGAGIDKAIGGGLVRAALHEAFAETVADAPALRGVAVGFALRASNRSQPIAWISHDLMAGEIGSPDASGLAQFGLDPGRVLLVQARDVVAALRSASEAAHCKPLGAVIVECWGQSKALDLTATRRLTLASQRSGVTVILARAGALPSPSAAETRWGVRARPSCALAAGSPGYPAFELSLLRHRRGVAGKTWCVEWSSDEHRFHHAALPGGRLHASADRPAAPQAFGRVLRLAG